MPVTIKSPIKNPVSSKFYISDPNDIIQKLASDPNALLGARDQRQGIWGCPLHVTAKQVRVGSRDYILATDRAVDSQGRSKYPLFLQLNTLATKVLFKDLGRPLKKPQTIGVEYLECQSLYSADPRYDASNRRTLGRAYARKEVTVSGGTFNSPQLLKLSGIGPAAELAHFNISVVVDLPGVGNRLQDNHEVPSGGLAARNFTSAPPNPNAPACTFGFPGDPCVALWREGQGPYTVPGPLNSIFRKTPSATFNARDFFLVGGNFAIRGFVPPTDSFTPSATRPTFSPSPPSISTPAAMPAPSSLGPPTRATCPRSTSTSSSRTANADLHAELDTVKWARRVFASVPAPLGPITPTEPPCLSSTGVPAADGTCDGGADLEWIRN
ncbi:hypothetical protein DL771_006823 [Monosporascus sp. 5C6A]|nr:hypothetical protein DL771_006823 [Monosporascus sp. 5C6A]